MEDDEAGGPGHHFAVAPKHPVLGIALLETEHIVCPGQNLKIWFAPPFRPIVGLGLIWLIAMQLNLWKPALQREDCSRHPEIGPHRHTALKNNLSIRNGPFDLQLKLVEQTAPILLTEALGNRM